MPKTRQEKEITINSLTEDLARFKAAVFFDFTGLKVKHINQLRRLCEKEKINYIVAKKTIMKIALEKAGIAGFEPKSLVGNVAMAIGFEDEVAPAKLIAKFAKDNEALKLLAGILVAGPKEYKFLDLAGVKSLASLPSKLELLAKMVGSIQAPLAGLVNVLSGNLRGLVQVLNSIKDKKTA